MKSKSKSLAFFRRLWLFLLSGTWIDWFGDDCRYQLPAHFDHCGYIEEKTGRGQWCSKSICPYLIEAGS